MIVRLQSTPSEPPVKRSLHVEATVSTLPSTTLPSTSLPSATVPSNTWSDVVASIPPEHRMGLAVVTVSSAVLNFGFGCIVPVLPGHVAGTLGLSATGVGVVLAAPSVARLAMNSACGRLSDARGRVPMMAGGELLAAGGVAASGLAVDLPSMLAARLCLGAGGAAASAGSAAWTADLTSLPSVRLYRGAVLGTMAAFVSGAWVLGPAVGGILSEQYGVQAMFVGVGLTTTACAGAYALLVKDIHGSASSSPKQKTFSWDLLDSQGQRGAVVANAALASNYALALAILPLQCSVVMNAGPLEIGYLFSAVSAVGIVGGPLSGYVSDKFGRAAVICPGLAVCAVGDALLAVASDATSLIVAAFVWGVGESVAAPAIAAVSADVAPDDRRAESLALSRSASDFSFLVAPPAMGLVADLASPSAPLALAACATGLAAIHAQTTLKS